jgi:hypothetical protein
MENTTRLTRALEISMTDHDSFGASEVFSLSTLATRL